MKNLTTLLFSVTVGLIAIAGCTSPVSSQQSGAMDGMPMSASDMKSMCDKHKKMMDSMSPADQKKMMEAHMKDMSPEMREKHMHEMSQCK